MKKLIFLFALSIFLYSCGGDKKSNDSKSKTTAAAPVDDGKGFGVITEVKLNNPLDQEMVERGRVIYDMKCASCHKKSDKRVVGPGFAGLPDRRKPEWIMNMVTNVETMLEKDPTAQKLLEECLTRMPNQNVTIDDARDILEFIYQNNADQKAKKEESAG